MKVAAYLRVSTEEQDPDLQRRAIAKWVEAHGAEAEWFEEKLSGAVKRPKFEMLMVGLRRGLYQAVVCWRFDRLSRSAMELLALSDECRSRGVDLVSLTDGIDTTTPGGQFFFTVIAAFAQFERSVIRERVKAGMAAAKARGQRFGRPEARVPIREAIALLDAGHSIRKVAKALKVARTTLRRAIAEARRARVS